MAKLNGVLSILSDPRLNAKTSLQPRATLHRKQRRAARAERVQVTRYKENQKERETRYTMSSKSTTSLLSVRNPSSTSDTTSDSDASVGVRLVRFDERCVLIPSCSGKHVRQPPRMGTLQLPIPVGLPWRWPGSPSPKDKEFGSLESAQGNEAAVSVAPRSPEAQHVVLKVPYPIFRRKSHSALQSAVICPPPCLVHRQGPSPTSPRLRHSASDTSSAATPAFSQSQIQGKTMPKKRSNSLPLPPQDQNVETIPLRPCCEKCLAACEMHRKRLPTLEESSREHTPSQSRLNLLENEGYAHTIGEEEDWCAGLHFTKGALRLRRSASADHGARHSQEGSGLLSSLVRVDEVDRKRGTSPTTSPRNSLSASTLKIPLGALNTRDLERVKGMTPPNRSPTGSDEPEEDLFPLPSPKRSPAASPADSATCLPVQVPPTEPRRLEAAIKAKMAEREKVLAVSPSSASVISSPIPIPGAKEGVSHFRSHADEIEYDPTLPDPDELPADSTILLNSPPGSPGLMHSSAGRSPSLSPSPPALHLHSPEPFSLSPPKHVPVAAANIPVPSIPSQGRPLPRPANRRASLSNIMRAGVGVLRGISLSVPTTQGGPPPSLSNGLLA